MENDVISLTEQARAISRTKHKRLELIAVKSGELELGQNELLKTLQVKESMLETVQSGRNANNKESVKGQINPRLLAKIEAYWHPILG